MKKKNERSAAMRFILKLFIFLIPFISLLAVYFLNDPFMVLKHYDRYDNSPVMLNESYIGWQMYMNNRDSIAFDSFIMGNSCTMAYPCREWEKYLNGGRAIRLFGNAESIAAICKKLQALEENGAEIKNLLLILDKESLGKDQLLNGHNYVLPPALSGISNFSFQEKFCQAFFFPNFLLPYLDYKIFQQYRPYMKGVINPYGVVRDPVTNDAINPREEMIQREGEAYWESHKKEFQKTRDPNYRNGKYRKGEPFLWQAQIELLEEISQICRKHNTSVKIIISPDYSQISINPADVEILKRFFGDTNVFDFSGINEYTNDIHNYYERGHYRPILGTRLLQKIYCKQEQIENI